jgi:aminomethyltransferase
MEFRGTPFHKSGSERNATRFWYAWDHYLVPDMFTETEAELQSLRNAAAVVDMSPLPKAEIAGPDAAGLVNRVLTRDARAMEVGHAIFSPLCSERGYVVTDGLVFRLAEDRFRISGDSAYEWPLAHAGGLDVRVTDRTDEMGILSIQGPRSQAILAEATGESWEGFRFSRLRHARIAGREVSIARQGFTGEHGYEIWLAREDGEAVWESVLEAGAPQGLVPAGEYAADIARVEAGIVLIRADYTGDGPALPYAHGVLNPDYRVTPWDLGMEKWIDFDKGDFVGREALLKMREGDGERRGFTGLDFDIDRIFALLRAAGSAPNVATRVRWAPMQLIHEGVVVGRATSATWSPTLRKLIGFGCLRADLIAEGREDIQVEWQDETGKVVGLAKARQVATPFVAHARAG